MEKNLNYSKQTCQHLGFVVALANTYKFMISLGTRFFLSLGHYSSAELCKSELAGVSKALQNKKEVAKHKSFCHFSYVSVLQHCSLHSVYHILSQFKKYLMNINTPPPYPYL